jgi:hypothetical protein
MPKLNTKDGELDVPVSMIAKMADRMFRLGGEGRSANYLEKAKKRLEVGPCRKADAATVLAAVGN